jgi:CBS domain-containing protein
VRRDVVTLPSNMPTVAAFALMLNRGVSGAGVVDAAAMAQDADPPLLSSLSISDIRVLHRAADFDALALPVVDFLLYQYGSVPAAMVPAGAAPPTQATPSAASGVAGTPTEVATAAAQVAAMEVSVAAGEGGEAEGAALGVIAATAAAALPSADALAAAMEEPAPEAPRLWLVSCRPESTLREARATICRASRVLFALPYHD